MRNCSSPGSFHVNPLLKDFLQQTTITGGPPTWSRTIDVEKAKTLGISARIAAIGPPGITCPVHKNPALVSFCDQCKSKRSNKNCK